MRKFCLPFAKNLPIAKEGYPFLVFSLALAVIFSFVFIWGALLFGLLFLFFLQFYRDPKRETPSGQALFTSPADGKIVAMHHANDPYTGESGWKISIFMHAFNVHRTRIPHDGIVQQRQDVEGSFFNAALDKSSEKNERSALVIAAHEGFAYTCVQVAGLLARRIVCYAHVGDHVARGAPYGFIHFGSRLDVYLPECVEINVSLGDRVKGGESILARLI
jgi:phosphatidylserine decarboxylase